MADSISDLYTGDMDRDSVQFVEETRHTLTT